MSLNNIFVSVFYSDNVNKIRYRYSCGHSVCEECIKINNICGLCIPTLSNTSPVIDNPQSDGVQHASQLLDRFQSSFNIDGMYM